jgi:hypothetical protein
MASGNCNTLIGTEITNKTGGNNNIGIGYQVQFAGAGGSNEVTIGNNSNNLYRVYAAWTVVSDARDKTDIEDLDLGLDFVKELQPRKFTWNFRPVLGSSGEEIYSDRNGDPDIGFIAQEVAAAQEGAGYEWAKIANTDHPNQFMVADTKLIPVLVNAIKELSATVESLQSQVASLSSRLDALEG